MNNCIILLLIKNLCVFSMGNHMSTEFYNLTFKKALIVIAHYYNDFFMIFTFGLQKSALNYFNIYWYLIPIVRIIFIGNYLFKTFPQKLFPWGVIRIFSVDFVRCDPEKRWNRISRADRVRLNTSKMNGNPYPASLTWSEMTRMSTR